MATVPNIDLQENPQPVPAKQSVYWPQLDGLRFLAFFLVFMSHLEPFPVTPKLPATLASFLKHWNTFMAWGWVGVDLFFVLSGFLITSLLLKEREKYGEVSFRLFFTRRALRIWPLYFFIVLLGFVLLPAVNFFNIALGEPAWDLMIRTYLPWYLVFLANFCFVAPLTASIPTFLAGGWSVAMEEQFYVVWGIVVARIRKLATLGLIVAAALPATLLIRMAIQSEAESHHAFYSNTFTHLDPLLTGISLALLLSTGKLDFSRLEKWGPALFCLPVMIFLGMTLLLPNIHANHFTIVYAMTVIAIGAAVFLMSLLVWPPAKTLFSNPILIWAGQLTYGLYFFHPLALELTKPVVFQLFGPNFHSQIHLAWVAYALSSLILSVAMAMASWHLLEKHFNRARKHFSKVPSGAHV